MTFTEVAKLAGVSCSTVSRVANNSPCVAADTQQAVRRAMEQLGYTISGNRTGRGAHNELRSRVRHFGLFVLGRPASFNTPLFTELLCGASTAATDADAQLSFHFIPDARHLPAQVLEQRFDGVLLYGATSGREVRRYLRNVPTIWVMGHQRRPEWGDQVMPDNYEVGRLAAQRLIDRGHMHLAFLNLDRDHWPFRQYWLGFADVAVERDATLVKVDSVQPLDCDPWHRYSPTAVDELVSRALAIEPMPTGVFIPDNNQVALIQPALQNVGLRLSESATEVVSCNNEKESLLHLDPHPIEIDIRPDEIGRTAIELLKWRIQRPGADRAALRIEPNIVAHGEGCDIAPRTQKRQSESGLRGRQSIGVLV